MAVGGCLPAAKAIRSAEFHPTQAAAGLRIDAVNRRLRAFATGQSIFSRKPQVIAPIVENGMNGRLSEPTLTHACGGESHSVPQVPAVILRPNQQRSIFPRQQ